MEKKVYKRNSQKPLAWTPALLLHRESLVCMILISCRSSLKVSVQEIVRFFSAGLVCLAVFALWVAGCPTTVSLQIDQQSFFSFLFLFALLPWIFDSCGMRLAFPGTVTVMLYVMFCCPCRSQRLSEQHGGCHSGIGTFPGCPRCAECVQHFQGSALLCSLVVLPSVHSHTT